MRKMMLTSLAIGLFGCATSQDFRPADNSLALSPTGDYRASLYDVALNGAPVGRVRVWSSGAYKSSIGDHKVTLVKVNLQVENTSRMALTVDLARSWLDNVEVGSRRSALAAWRYEGSPVVPPESAGTVSLYFVLPAHAKPSQIDDFRLRWELSDQLG